MRHRRHVVLRQPDLWCEEVTVQFCLLIVALICFIAGAANIPWRVNWVSLGLAFWILSLILR